MNSPDVLLSEPTITRESAGHTTQLSIRGKGRYCQYLILRSNTLRGVSSVDGGSISSRASMPQVRKNRRIPDSRDDSALS